MNKNEAIKIQGHRKWRIVVITLQDTVIFLSKSSRICAYLSTKLR